MNELRDICSGVRNSAVASQPCPSGHITADKRLRPNSPIGELLLSARRYMKYFAKLECEDYEKIKG
jgi:hypothetical protein